MKGRRRTYHIYVTATVPFAKYRQLVKAFLLTDPSLKLGYAFTLMGPRASLRQQQHELDHQIIRHRDIEMIVSVSLREST